MESKAYFKKLIICLVLVLMLIIAIVVAIDPYFHYHKPLSFLSYPLEKERYQNDGIAKHFDYDAIITGTSMAENFKCSEFDDLFGFNSVKLCYSGGSFKEIGDNVNVALESNPNIKMVVRCLDYYKFAEDKDHMEYDSYPDYLYDKNIFNDVSYIFNRTTLKDCLKILKMTIKGQETTSFDDYGAWYKQAKYGKDQVLAAYTREENPSIVQKDYTESYKKVNRETIEQNVLQAVEAYPDVEFYFYLPPYSICAWDVIYNVGNMKIVMEEQRYIIKMLLEYDNVHVFAFLDCYEDICNLDNYMDTSHYGEWINSYMLQCFKRKEHEITRENVDSYCDEVENFYLNYDYQSIN